MITTKQWGDQRAEFKINSSQLLSEIREKLSKTVQVNLKPGNVSNLIINQIEEILAQHPGRCSFNVSLVEESENISVDLLSRKFMVNPNDELLKSLEDIPEIQYKVNS